MYRHHMVSNIFVCGAAQAIHYASLTPSHKHPTKPAQLVGADPIPIPMLLLIDSIAHCLRSKKLKTDRSLRGQGRPKRFWRRHEKGFVRHSNGKNQRYVDLSQRHH